MFFNLKKEKENELFKERKYDSDVKIYFTVDYLYLYGCFIVFMVELKFIYLGSLLVLFGGWQTLIEKDG
tara:strand:+ start:866 stop:1072 length:207 start_codon:yes stop_codon:yes gene_type:complete